MNRAYYSSNVGEFLKEYKSSILDKISKNNQFATELDQRNT